MAQIMNSLLQNSDLKEVEKTTRLFRYDLNQIPYDYTLKVTNRFKGLDLIVREICNIVSEVTSKTTPKENAQRQNGCLRRAYNSWGEKWKAKEKKKDILIWKQSSKE